MRQMANLSENITLFVISFVAGLIAVALVRYVCNKNGWVAHPQKDRWHTKSTALHGGVGIMLAWLPLVLTSLNTAQVIPQVFYFFFAGLIIIFFVGFLDDIYHFRPRTKLVWQIIVALLVVSNNIVIQFSTWGILNQFVTIIWIVGMINAVNMIDNMDGLSAGIVLIVSIFVWYIMFNTNNQFTSLPLSMVVIFGGVLVGFLFFNYNPASIFMGDSGSLFIGYFISVMVIPSEINSYFGINKSLYTFDYRALVIPVMLMAIPITDLLFVSVNRFLAGKKIYQGGRDHMSHRLVNLGYKERKSVFILYFCGVLSGLSAILSTLYAEYILVLICLVLIMLILLVKFIKQDKKV